MTFHCQGMERRGSCDRILLWHRWGFSLVWPTRRKCWGLMILL